MFLVCGTYAFVNLSFPPISPIDELSFPLSSLSPHSHAPTPVVDDRRSRRILTVLVLLTFLALGVAGAVVGSTVMAFVLFGFFKAANYNMSTYVPAFFQEC